MTTAKAVTVRKKNVVERKRASGARFIVRAVLDPRGSYVVIEEISKGGEVRSVRVPAGELVALSTGVREAQRWWRSNGGTLPPMELG